jgi:hypothetical protein
MSSKPINFNKIDVSKISFTKLEDNPRVNSQKIGYVRYTLDDGSDVQFKVKTPKFCSEVYGVPREGTYYPDAKSRSHYKLGFCHKRKQQSDINYDEIKQFMELFMSVDEICDTEEFRKNQFGKDADKYEYQPLVRFTQEEIDTECYLLDENGNRKLDDKGKEIYRPPYTKIKLDLEYTAPDVEPTNKPTFAIAELKDGKRTNVELNTFEDAVKMLRYLSKLRFIIIFNKIYAQKKASGAGKNAKKTYGITIKATNIEVEPSGYVISSDANEDAFADSDTEDIVVSTNKITRQQNQVQKGNLDDNINDDDEDDIEELQNDDIDDDQEEVVEEAPVISKSLTKTKQGTTTTKSSTVPKKAKNAMK